MTGSRRIWRSVGALRSPSTAIAFREWDGQPRKLARSIILAARQDGITPTIFFAGYSYGCGHFFREFAAELHTAGLRIEQVVLCDPIHRFKFPLAKWRSLAWSPWKPTIKIPDNVRHVRWLRQTQDRGLTALRGHDLKEDDGNVTEIDEPALIPTTHAEADDHPSYARMVAEMVSLPHTIEDSQ